MQDKTTYLIDLSNMAYRNMYGVRLKTKTGMPSGHVFGTIRNLLALRKNTHDYELVFALDSKPRRKLELDPTYKANRARADGEFNPTPDIRKMVRYLKCTCIYNEDEEADDVIASYISKNQSESITIVSSDADLYQLIDRERGVRQYNPLDNAFITSDDLHRKFGLDQFIKVALWKALFGDSGDNVKPPIPRLKKADLIPAIGECDGTVDGFMQEVDGLFGASAMRIRDDQQFRAKLQKNLDLVELKRDLEYVVEEHSGNANFLNCFLRKFECESLINADLERILV